MGQVAVPGLSLQQGSIAAVFQLLVLTLHKLFAFSGFGTMSPLSIFALLLTQAALPARGLSAAVTILC